ncbi:MAG: hypothetical protein FRX49_02774 [Trebouxia sp. A1-2]|nr:MAG: hypothetical protein FRX49_02774 [Trebouxia sp. A1-2]
MVLAIINSGGIAAQGLALSQTRKLAISAVRLLDCMLVESQLPAQMVADSEAQLAGTKAVQRCLPCSAHQSLISNSRVSVNPRLQEAPSQPAMPVSKSSADNKGKITRATQTETPSHVPWQDRAEGRIAWQGFVLHDQLFNPVESWPTPSAAAWSDIQTVATRAFFMVEWTFLAVELPSPAGSQTSNTSDQPDCLSLTRDLAAFLHKLPAGHVLDFKLDMSRTQAQQKRTAAKATAKKAKKQQQKAKAQQQKSLQSPEPVQTAAVAHDTGMEH